MAPRFQLVRVWNDSAEAMQRRLERIEAIARAWRATKSRDRDAALGRYAVELTALLEDCLLVEDGLETVAAGVARAFRGERMRLVLRAIHQAMDDSDSPERRWTRLEEFAEDVLDRAWKRKRRETRRPPGQFGRRTSAGLTGWEPLGPRAVRLVGRWGRHGDFDVIIGNRRDAAARSPTTAEWIIAALSVANTDLTWLRLWRIRHGSDLRMSASDADAARKTVQAALKKIKPLVGLVSATRYGLEIVGEPKRLTPDD